MRRLGLREAPADLLRTLDAQPLRQGLRELELAAKKAGIEAAYHPIVIGKLTPDDVAAVDRMLEALPKTSLGFCRTGTRAATLWALSQVSGGRPVSEILAITKRAGYDLRGAVTQYAQRYPSAARRQLSRSSTC